MLCLDYDNMKLLDTNWEDGFEIFPFTEFCTEYIKNDKDYIDGEGFTHAELN